MHSSGVEIVLNLSAEELSERILKSVVEAPPYLFLFASAEVVLEKTFIFFLKYSGSKLHEAVAAVVANESHNLKRGQEKPESDILV